MSPAFQQVSAPPAPPAPVTPTPNVVSSTSLPGGAMTRQDIANLRARRSELSDQLESATGRRRSLAEQVRHADGVSKAGLEARLATLDQRIVRLEGELDQVGEQLGSPQAAQLVSETRAPANFEEVMHRGTLNLTPVAILGTLFVFAPMAISIARLIWKRGSRTTTAAPAMPAESNARLERIEQAVDAISIEVERVSEGQRFVTKLLSERGGLALNAAQPVAEPVRVPAGESSRVR